MITKPVYVVSGYMRSGTSMMMKALEKGGMTACYNRDKDRILTEKFERDAYHPNPEGFYELGRKEFDDPGFPSTYRGRVIKALHWKLKMFPPFQYNVVFMMRDPVEIEVSYLKMFRHRPPFVLKTYDEFMEKTLEELNQRGDMTITRIWHGDMIRDPRASLSRLIDRGFPITDIEAAAASVNPDLYRSKARDLEQVRKDIPGLRTDVPDFIKTTDQN